MLATSPRWFRSSLLPKLCIHHAKQSFSSTTRFMSAPQKPKVAVLYQALDPPIINGVIKPKKPGGYADSGADIGYVLKHKCAVEVITPKSPPDAQKDLDWCWPDTAEGIQAAVEQGATHLWANTILFSAHPLQNSTSLDPFEDVIRIIGQPPRLVEAFDDKALVYDILRKRGNFTLPYSSTIDQEIATEDFFQNNPSLNFPLVLKPVRGRGSHGVKVCYNRDEFESHLQDLFEQSGKVIVESFLAGEEATITVLPPSSEIPKYWALPIVSRFNHLDDIAPYNGVVAVTENSKVVYRKEFAADLYYAQASREYETIAELLQCKAPIRIDVRRFNDGKALAIFDVNMKPNMTGPGRPGRENQASLSAIAASGLGWDYPTLLTKILESASLLRNVRNVNP